MRLTRSPADRSATSSATCSRELNLPTLLVTHAFEDAAALARRVAVIDTGRVVQLATPAELLAAPANVMVAALTGANILEGTATPTPSGSTVRLHGGGELRSAAPASGAVHVAIHPWQLALADPNACGLTDTVLGVHHDRGALTIRLSRFTIQTPASDNGQPPVTEGTIVGVRATPRRRARPARSDVTPSHPRGSGERRW